MGIGGTANQVPANQGETPGLALGPVRNLWPHDQRQRTGDLRFFSAKVGAPWLGWGEREPTAC